MVGRSKRPYFFFFFAVFLTIFLAMMFLFLCWLRPCRVISEWVTRARASLKLCLTAQARNTNARGIFSRSGVPDLKQENCRAR
jgi:hypothetical protein